MGKETAMRTLALIPLLALAACIEPAPPAEPEPAPDLCNAASMQGLVGQPASVLQDIVYEVGKTHYGKEALRDWFKARAEALGCRVTVDDMGAMFARRAGTADVPPIAMGSHLDTQPTGGKYDGVLGVLGALGGVGDGVQQSGEFG